MKLNTTNIVIALVFIGIVLSSVCFSCATIIPYNAADAFTKNYPYEGFANLDYSSNNDHKSMDSYNQGIVNTGPTECEKVYGFDGLFCKPYIADNQVDIYSNSKGDPTCYGSSSGLSNSKGSLCLDANQKAMLQTRGGNATGKDSQNGQ